MEARWWTRLTGISFAHREGEPCEYPDWRRVDKHEKRIERSCRLRESDHSKKKSNFPWRRGRGGCNRFRSIPSPCSNELTGGIVSAVQRGGSLWEKQKASLFPPASPALSHATLHFLLLFTAERFRSDRSPLQKKGDSGWGEYRWKREKERERKKIYQIFPIIDVSRARAVRVSLWRDHWLAFFFFFCDTFGATVWKRSTSDI